MNRPRKRRWAAPAFAALCAIGVVLAVLASHASSATDTGPFHDLPLKRVADVALPGGATRLDSASLGATRHLLFIAHLGDGEVIAFDVRSQRVVARIENVDDVHGVLAFDSRASVLYVAAASVPMRTWLRSARPRTGSTFR